MHESEETRLRRDQEARDRCQDAKSTGRAFGHVSCFVRESSTSWVLPHMAIHGVLFWLPTTFTNFLLSLYVIVIPIAYSFMFLWYFWFWKFWFQRLLCGASAFPWLTWFRGCYGPHAFGNFVSFLGDFFCPLPFMHLGVHRYYMVLCCLAASIGNCRDLFLSKVNIWKL